MVVHTTIYFYQAPDYCCNHEKCQECITSVKFFNI